MIGFVRDGVEAFFGRGAHSTAVPVMDGPLRPNHALDDAEVLLSAEGVDNLVASPDGLLFSSGPRILKAVAGKKAAKHLDFEAPVSCMSRHDSGALAVGLDGTGILISGGSYDGRRFETLGGDRFICPTAVVFLDENTLLVAAGSSANTCADWKRDLMTGGRSGAIWKLGLADGAAECLAGDLAYPYGLATTPDSEIVFAEAWRHRLLRHDTQGRNAIETVLGNLPAYPSRIVAAKDGGYWLSLFAPRNQLVEFVLREKRFRQDMIANVDAAYWIAPALRSGESFREVLQGGAVKQMGILKPWAPALSYGLVVRLDAEFQPKASWHSRADGSRHGITSICEMDGLLIAAAKGPGLALRIDPESSPGEFF